MNESEQGNEMAPEELEEIRRRTSPPEEDIKGIPDWMLSKTGLKETIPTETEGEWIQIEYDMLPVGATDKIWGEAQNVIAHVEADIQSRGRKGKKVSQGVIAQLVQSYYLISAVKRMVRKINGEAVQASWWDVHASQSLGSVMQVWMSCKLKHKPYPDPPWILRFKGQLKEAQQAEGRPPGPVVDDPPRQSGDTDSPDITD